MSSRTRRPLEADAREKLEARIQDLELRIKLLEGRMREVSARTEPQARPAQARHRPRPRCPGCLLELPVGRRGERCVWCGFMFEAVSSRAVK